MSSSEKSHFHDPLIPIAYGIYPEDRLGQLRHVFYTREIPQDDSIEVADPEPTKEKSNKPKKPAIKLTNPFKSKPKKQAPNPGKTVEQTPAEQKPKVKPKPKQSARNPGKTAKQTDAPAEQKSKPKPKQPQHRASTGRSKQSSGESLHESSTSKRDFSTLSDVPSDLSTLTVNDVTKCLDLLNLSHHKETFENRLIDGEMLACLTETMLSLDFGFSEFEAIQLSRFAKGYRPKIA